jgi:antitoxin component YwqK of YwqJK toxin-antitoxin module
MAQVRSQILSLAMLTLLVIGCGRTPTESGGVVLSRHGNRKPKVVTERFLQGKPDGVTTIFRIDGSREAEGRMAMGVRQGPWNVWAEDGSLSSTIEYADDVPDGLWRTFHLSTRVATEVAYRKGLRHGRARRWASGGALLEDVRWVNDRLDGPGLLFAPDGSKLASGVFKGDEKHGLWTRWHPNGLRAVEGAYDGLQAAKRREKERASSVRDQSSSAAEEPLGQRLDDGFRVGPWTWWFDSGKVERTGRFEADLEEGTWERFHPNGRLRERMTCKAGLASGPFEVFDDDGRPLEKGSFLAGERHGEISDWFRGTLTVGTYDRGRLHGPRRQFDKDGLLVTEEEFREGKLIRTGSPPGRAP